MEKFHFSSNSYDITEIRERIDSQLKCMKHFCILMGKTWTQIL